MLRTSTLLLASVLFATSAFAQHPAAAGEKNAPMAAMDCKTMMHDMQASSKAMDDKLQGLVDEMNQATGSAKIDRMAAVITEITAQRTQMRDQMMTMMPKMMGHMAEHMKGSGSQSMADCPMMKGAEKTPEAAPHKQ